MLLSFLFAAAMTVLPAATVSAAVPAELKASPPAAAGEPLNIGFVLYTKSHVRGTLNAR